MSQDAPAAGFYVAPVLFGAVDPDAVIAQEEVFGPVLSLFPFDDEQDAIRLANGTEYGLVAGMWTRDGARQHRVAKARSRRAGLSSMPTVLAAASNCRLAASRNPVTAARRASRPSTTCPRPRRSSFATIDRNARIKYHISMYEEKT